MASALASSMPCSPHRTAGRSGHLTGEQAANSAHVQLSHHGWGPRRRCETQPGVRQRLVSCQLISTGNSTREYVRLVGFGSVASMGQLPRWQRGVHIGAKRRESTAKIDEDDDLDEDLKVGLNEVSNEAVRVMLSDDIQQVAAFKKKVDYLGEFLVEEGQLEAARFMLVIQGMLDHTVPVEHEDLKGAYKKAFEKIGSIMEDSGWVLAQPGEEPNAALEMIDDELIPPVLRPY